MKKVELREFDASRYLDSEEMIAEYLSEVYKEGGESAMKSALTAVAKARNMSEIARKMGVSRSSLYNSLDAGVRTEFSTIQGFLDAIGIEIEFRPKESVSERFVGASAGLRA